MSHDKATKNINSNNPPLDLKSVSSLRSKPNDSITDNNNYYSYAVECVSLKDLRLYQELTNAVRVRFAVIG
ncbi:hypothetical protein BB561_004145 [Smittium simulii]|uniref:Uncharacterized protein n=1 Tax=Smittium simulii TaxID=133385 RepID=A0A2T9YHW8_9FUNG|nr:hypothetical protein BB561_004145 [Smittium simulii]